MTTIAYLSILGGGSFAGSTHAYEENALYAGGPAVADLILRGATFEWKIGDRIVNTGTVNRYVPDDADIGKPVSVTAIVPDPGSAGVIRYASYNAKTVVDVNDRPTGTLTFNTEAVGTGTRHTAVDLIGDEDGRGPMSYQWFVNGKAIAGANGSEFILESPFAGQPVTLHGTYTDALGRATTVVVSPGTAPHVDTPGIVTILGTLAPHTALRASVFDPDAIETIHFQWEAMDTQGSWSSVQGATGPELAIGASVPAAVRVLVDHADSYGVVTQRATVLGTEGADRLIATPGLGETIFAAGGNDIVANAMRVDGGAGLDTYTADWGLRLFYQTPGKPAEWNAESTLADTTSVLTNVERVQWANRAVALDIDGNAGQAYRLYEAAFDRTADMVGLGFWMSRLDKGVSLETIADAFVASSEFKSLYGANPTNAQVVDRFYANILERAPDPIGVAFWNRVLDAGAATVGEVLIEFSESAENIAALVGTVQYGINYTPYTGA